MHLDTISREDQPSNNSYLTPSELSARWRNSVTTRTLANWRVRGFGPQFLKLGGRVVYCLTDVVKWETTRKREV